jgi:response regulator RpfG family c-di-GMP phosphodiesterase
MNNNNSLLLVDDEPNVLKSLRRLLIDTNYNVYSAESAETPGVFWKRKASSLLFPIIGCRE